MSGTNDVGYNSAIEGKGLGNKVTPNVANTTDVNANQYITPATTAYPVVYSQQQPLIYPPVAPAYQTNQHQPNVQSDFVNQVAANAVNKLSDENERLQKEVEAYKNGQNSKEKNPAIDALTNKIRDENIKKTIDFYTNQKKAEEENRKELDELRKYKEDQKKKEEEQRQKEELEKKFKDRESELKNIRQELDEREDVLYSMNLNSQADREEFASYKEKTSQVEDLKEYGETLKNFYEQQIKINDDEKKQKSEYIEKLENETKTKIGQIATMEQNINSRKASENIITKIINFLTGKRDKKSEELKEKIKKLTEDIKEGNTTIEQQKQELKAIEKRGLEMIKEKLDEMKQNSQDQIKDLKDKKQLYEEVKNSKDYKDLDKDIFKNNQLDKLQRRREQMDLINSMSLKRSKDIYAKYDMKQPDNQNARYSTTSINNAKSKNNGRY